MLTIGLLLLANFSIAAAEGKGSTHLAPDERRVDPLATSSAFGSLAYRFVTKSLSYVSSTFGICMLVYFLCGVSRYRKACLTRYWPAWWRCDGSTCSYFGSNVGKYIRCYDWLDRSPLCLVNILVFWSNSELACVLVLLD